MKTRLLLFFIIAIAHLTAIIAGFEQGQVWTKPMLMLSLLFFFLGETSNANNVVKKFVITALVFSLAGDVLLIFSKGNDNGQLFFLAGLGSFLITQICYAVSFSKLKKTNAKVPVIYRAYLLPGVFLILILSIIWSELPAPLKIPVIIYALAIATMFSFSLQLKDLVPERVFLFITVGALLFMCSDSLIAVNKFTERLSNIWNPSFWVMFTYILGQAGIVIGLTKALSSFKK